MPDTLDPCDKPIFSGSFNQHYSEMGIPNILPPLLVDYLTENQGDWCKPQTFGTRVWH